MNKYQFWEFFKEYTAATASATIASPPSGKAVRLLGYIFSTSASGSCTLDIAGSNFAKFYLADWGGANLASSADNPIAAGKDDQALKLTTLSVTNFSARLWGYFE